MLFNNEVINNPIESNTVLRRKRLKVVNACNECRRKKIKCNGEKTCIGCIKSKIECKYSINIKSKVTTPKFYQRPIIPSIAKPRSVVFTPPCSPVDLSSVLNQQEINSQYLNQINHSLTNSVKSIEDRLGAIEAVLNSLVSNIAKKNNRSSNLIRSNKIQNLLNNDIIHHDYQCYFDQKS